MSLASHSLYQAQTGFYLPEVFHLGDENVLGTIERSSNIADIIHHRNGELFTGTTKSNSGRWNK